MIRIVSTTTRAMRLKNEGQLFEEFSFGTTKYSHCKSELKKLKFGGLGILETNPEGMRQIIKHLSIEFWKHDLP